MKLAEQKKTIANKSAVKKNLPRIKEIKNTHEVSKSSGGAVGKPKSMGIASVFLGGC